MKVFMMTAPGVRENEESEIGKKISLLEFVTKIQESGGLLVMREGKGVRFIPYHAILSYELRED